MPIFTDVLGVKLIINLSYIQQTAFLEAHNRTRR
jgi:hypothetical protein